MIPSIGKLSKRSQYPGIFLFPFILLFFLLGVFLLFPLTKGYCAQVVLTWDPNSEPDLAGYQIYYGTSSGSYQWNKDVGNFTTNTLYGLDLGVTYYIAATAYNAQGIESGFSNEVVFSVPSCTYAISPSSFSFSASGGTGSVLVTTPAGCNWGTSDAPSWVTVNSGPIIHSGSGTGNGSINIIVSPNNGTTERVASLTIAGNVFTITEAGLSYYHITASTGKGGLISPSGGVSVLPGTNQTFTITANAGYKITDVEVDGVSQGAIASYTFSAVGDNHTISATFAAIIYYSLSITESGPGSGSVSVNPVGTSFAAGTLVTLTATPDPGFVFGGWSGACSGTTATCQVTMNSNQSVSAAFSTVTGPPTVTTGPASSVTLDSATLNGTVNPNGLSTTYVIQWGLTTSYNNIMVVQSVGSGITAVPISANLTDLIPNTLYYYRVVATNDAGTTLGPDNTFFSQFMNNIHFKSDGQTDILWRHKTTGQVAVWFMNGITPTGSAVVDDFPSLDWVIVGTGDFNGNGKPGILWRHNQSGQIAFWTMNGVTPTSTTLADDFPDLDWVIVGTGDFNSDGKPDILWRHKISGQITVWFMNGVSRTSTALASDFPDLDWEVVGTGDFNGDGKPDILWRHKISGQITVWFMNGATRTSTSVVADFPYPEWEIVGTRDFNSDGKPDILWRHKISGQITVWYMNGITHKNTAVVADFPYLDWVISGY